MAIDDFLRVAWWCGARVACRYARRCSRSPSPRACPARAGPSGAGRGACRPSDRGISSGRIWSLERTLADPRVVEAIHKLRGQYPPGRVGWLRFRSEVAEGADTGDHAPLAAVIDVLAGPAAEAEVRRDAPESVRGPLARSRVEAAVAIGAMPVGPIRGPSLDADGPDTAGDEDESASLYLAVLLAIAMLLASVERGRLTRVA